jgi:hypothetical protein
LPVRADSKILAPPDASARIRAVRASERAGSSRAACHESTAWKPAPLVGGCIHACCRGARPMAAGFSGSRRVRLTRSSGRGMTLRVPLAETAAARAAHRCAMARRPWRRSSVMTSEAASRSGAERRWCRCSLRPGGARQYLINQSPPVCCHLPTWLRCPVGC